MSPESPELIMLWDGATYRVDDIEKACAPLPEYARAHPTLVETMPPWRLKSANGVALIAGGVLGAWLIPVLAVWGIASLKSGRVLGDAQDIGALLFFVAVSVVPGVFFWIGVFTSFPEYRPTISVRQGTMVISTSGRSIRASLDECRWFHGKVADTHLFSGSAVDPVFIFEKTLVIELPRASRWDLRPFRVAVGYTPEMRAIWEAFLTIANVPNVDSLRRSLWTGNFPGGAIRKEKKQ